MDRFEEAVMEYICSKPDCFIKTQMSLPWDDKNKIGGSLPDFVVLDFREKTVYIVEVTTAFNIKGILTKASEREARWYRPIRNYEAAWVKNIVEWEFRVCLFLRDQLVDKAKKEACDWEDVSIISLNCTTNPWEWEWNNDNVPSNPLS
ncbi:hypothetical protein Q8W40_04345 [Vibrio penaeicida]|uniref:hypothetical protein n=1 Tax=Vibrio penaeicida TaxID=104609 RepID=UPI00273600CD|nr:hypothetical protein [Vibrio penaeicida]MDP2571403.1 hypothetical protein [Vibrio penaeicida]